MLFAALLGLFCYLYRRNPSDDCVTYSAPQATEEGENRTSLRYPVEGLQISDEVHSGRLKMDSLVNN